MEELKEKIVNDINEAKLPIDCVYYLVKDLFRDLEISYQQYLMKQKSENSEKIENKENGGNIENGQNS